MPPRWHQRKSPRLRGYDYSQQGAYFITVCTQNREALFGRVADQQMHLNAAGEMVGDYWQRIAERFPTVELDAWVVMPNHIHGIIVLSDDRDITVTRLLHWFKLETTKSYSRGVKHHHWPSFDRRLWQRSYHDHIIRDDNDLTRIRDYVLNNPALWQNDTFHPENSHKTP